jgi:hypothetical protein
MQSNPVKPAPVLPTYLPVAAVTYLVTLHLLSFLQMQVQSKTQDLVNSDMPEPAAADINIAVLLAQVQLLLLPPKAAKATPESTAAACIELAPGVVVIKQQDDTTVAVASVVLYHVLLCILAVETP